MPFEKGRRKSGGRLPRVTNKFTGTFREAVQVVYDGLGGHSAFLEWASKNRSEYYRIASRLIPAEMREGNKDPVRVFIYANDGSVSPVGLPATNPRPVVLDHTAAEGKDRDAS